MIDTPSFLHICNMKKWIPNIFTFLNLLMGCVAVLFAMFDHFMMAGLFVALGIFFDFFDGLAARLLNVSSELGKQLDSLADMVTSGFVPGIVIYKMLCSTLGFYLLNFGQGNAQGSSEYWFAHPYLPLIGFVITLASCYRLAKFNIDTRQTDSFIGLPTPANAILIISIAIISQTPGTPELTQFIKNPIFLIGLTLLSSYLLNAELPLFALKFKSFGFKGNELRYVFILLCVTLLVILKIYAVPCIVVLYILLSIINNIVSIKSENKV